MADSLAVMSYFHARYKHFRECVSQAKHHWAFLLIGLAIAIYSFVENVSPVVDFAPITQLFAGWPKLPLPWAAILVLFLALLAIVEGSYQLRIKEKAALVGEYSGTIQTLKMQLEGQRAQNLSQQHMDDITLFLSAFIDKGKKIISNAMVAQQTGELGAWEKECNDWQAEVDLFLRSDCSVQASVTFMDSSGNLDVSSKFYSNTGLNPVLARYLCLLDKRVGNLVRIVENPQLYFSRQNHEIVGEYPSDTDAVSTRR